MHIYTYLLILIKFVHTQTEKKAEGSRIRL